jgi:hypothetical protein
MSIESLVEVRGLTKKYAMTKHFGVVAVLTDDISGMTYVARWIKTGFLEEVPEGLSWDEITKLAKNYEREWQGLTENEIKHLWYEACQTNLELTSQLVVHLARNIEAKLKERNT